MASRGWLFAEFVVNSTRYAAIYSGFAILIVFMIWLYVSWLILLIGAQISYYHQHPHYIYLPHRDIKLSPQLFDRLGFLIMYLIAKHFRMGNPLWTIDTLSQRLALPELVIENVVDTLKKRNLILAATEEPSALIPARDPSTIALSEILEAIRTSPAESLPIDPKTLSISAVDHLLEKLHACTLQATEGVSLKDLVDS